MIAKQGLTAKENPYLSIEKFRRLPNLIRENTTRVMAVLQAKDLREQLKNFNLR